MVGMLEGVPRIYRLDFCRSKWKKAQTLDEITTWLEGKGIITIYSDPLKSSPKREKMTRELSFISFSNMLGEQIKTVGIFSQFCHINCANLGMTSKVTLKKTELWI